MCVKPRYINVSKERFRSVDNGLPIYRRKLSETVICGCGHCVECKKQKQNEWYPRIVSELRHCFEAGLPAVFVTLTYRDECLPMTEKKSFEVFDTRQKWVKDILHMFKRVEFVEDDIVYHWLNTSTGELLTDDEYRSFTYYLPKKYREVLPQPTLRYEDVRLWLKRCRIRMQRGFYEHIVDDEIIGGRSHCPLEPLVPLYDDAGNPTGEKSHIQFHCIGEYSPEKHRPHYHLLIIGIDYKQFMEYCYWDWFDHFGITDCSDIDFQKKGALSHYLSKYCCKPTLTNFETTLAFKVREPSRIHASKFFGMAYWRLMGKWHRAEEVTDLEKRAELIVNRLYYAENEFRYKLPTYYFKRLFDYETERGRDRPVFYTAKEDPSKAGQFKGLVSTYKDCYTDESLALQNLVMDLLRERAVQNLAEQLPQLGADFIRRNYLEVRMRYIMEDADERADKIQRRQVEYYRSHSKIR